MFSSGDRTRPVNSDDDPGDDGARDLDLQEGSSIEMEAELERVVPAKDDEPDTTITKPRLQPQLSSSALSGRQSAKKSNKESRSEQGSKIISTSKQHRKTDQQSAMESGVAQIANIGSIISSTFGVFNDRFSKFDDILEQSTRRTEEISGESRSQMNKISFLKNAVDGMQDQMMEMISSVQQLQVNVAEALNQKKSEEAVQAEKVAISDREETLAKHEQIEIQATALKQQRDELLDRIMDLEREIQLIKTRPVQPEGIPSGDAVTAEVASIASVALSKQRDELQISVSGLEKKIDEHEALLHNTRLTIVNLDIAAIAEDKVVGIQHLSIKLKKIDFGDEPLEDGSESEVISSKWEPALPPQDVGVATDVFSEKKKTPRVSIAAAVNNEAMQLMAESIAKMREDAAIDRETAAATIEEMNQRILELENVVATHNGNNVAQVRDINERLLDLQDGVQSAAGATTAIKRLQLSMNDVIAEVDELKYKESSPNDDVVSSGQQIGGHPQGPPDHLNTASLLLDIEINSVKNKLLNLRDDLDNGLDTYADAHAGDPEGTDAFESPFIARVAEFADRLDNVILSFYPKETPEATLLALFYPLDALTIELESLFELDQQSVSMMGITFDDVTAEGSNRNVRDTMRHVWEASLPLLDHRVNKITMRRRLTALEGIVRNKADVVGITVLEAELRRLISSKADHKELLSIASKKVSLGELQRLKDQLMKQIVSIRGFEYSQSGTSGPVIGTPRDRSGEGGLTSAEGLEMSAEMKQLGRRFDILHSFHEDLAAQCGAYVPREEVEQALRALLGEMKIMKGNSISPDLLGESLKTKANAAEVQK